MKILQINKFFYLKGGSERYFFNLCNLLEKQAHNVIPFSTKHYKNFPYLESMNFAKFSDLSQKHGFFTNVIHGLRVFYNLNARKQLKKIIKEHDPDVAHIHNFFGHLSPSIIKVLKKNHIPIVVTLHDYKFFCPNYQLYVNDQPCFDCLRNNSYRPCVKKRCLKNSFGYSLIGALENTWATKILKIQNDVDLFIAPSQYMRQKGIRWGIDNEKIVHLPNFIENSWLKFKTSAPYIKKPYFIFYGRLSQEKGADDLIRAFMRVTNRLPGWRSVIVGDGPDAFRLKKLAANTNKIEFVGFKTGQELKELIKNSQLVIIPSKWPENMPYAAIESFALGKAIICAQIGGLTSLTNRGKYGILYKAGDIQDLAKKLVWAAEHTKKLELMGKEAKKHANVKYSSQVHYKKLMEIYDRITNN